MSQSATTRSAAAAPARGAAGSIFSRFSSASRA